MNGFLKLLMCGYRYACVLCVYTPEAINNYSREMKPEQPVKQVILLSGLYIQHLLSIFFEGLALATKCILNFCPKQYVK